MRVLLLFSIVLLGAAAGGAQTPAAELKVGDMAPDFSLQGADGAGQPTNWSDFKGKQAVVLAWFPKAFTGGCTIECKSLGENGGNDQEVQRSVPSSPASSPIEGDQGNKAFAEAQKAGFPS